MARILGLDFGGKTVGVAVSDELGWFAHGVETIRRTHENKLRKTLSRIEILIQEKNVDRIVLGLPLHLNGEKGIRVEKTLEFRDMLVRRTGLPVIMHDERLTTVEAYQTMDELGISGMRRKALVDEIAAVFILQDYLDSIRKKNTLY